VKELIVSAIALAGTLAVIYAAEYFR